ncbi:MAG TPA: rod shape-determining protein RodA [Patescibacteria group bacterium]|nr:rod shape-determining protein RodA [Patescibacteria group bacterium]
MYKFSKLDWVLNSAVFLLIAFGLAALWSISFEGASFSGANFEKQVISLTIGLLAMFFLAFYDYRVLNAMSTRMYFSLLALLLLVIFFGTTVRGTTGWIGISTLRFQPVEIAKVVLVIFLASFLSKKKNQLSIVVRTIVSIILIFLPIYLILKQPDFGSAAIILVVWIMMLLVSGINKKNLFILFTIGVLSFSSGWFLLKDYQKDRLVNFINPERDPQGSGYNVLQSIVAVGSGGLSGKGLGHGSQSQLNFLPEKHTDFIFAVISEELGFLGASVVFLLFGIIFFRIRQIAMGSRDNFGYLLAVGIMAMIFAQFLVNIGMNVGLMPVTGVPLPFLSYGGSSLVSILASIGIVQGIYLRREERLDRD